MFNTLLCGRTPELLHSRRSCRAIALRAAHPGPGKDSGETFFIPKRGLGCPCFGGGCLAGGGGISPHPCLCKRTVRAGSRAPQVALQLQAPPVSPRESHAKGQRAAEESPLLPKLCLCSPPPSPVHLRHSGGRKENPSENHNLITPICSGTASHFCLPGCLSPMLSSTLFSISCNHLLAISFSFHVSPWKGDSAGWEWAEPATRRAAQLGHSLKALKERVSLWGGIVLVWRLSLVWRLWKWGRAELQG